MPTRTPPARTTGRGPKRSTRYPSIGTSQVSVMTKIENATWIAARPHWNLASIGLTKSVHPYCRLATIAMQTMPKKSWIQRSIRRGGEAAGTVVEALIDLPEIVGVGGGAVPPRHRS